ncbi:hypothetical protein KY358_06685 [Candidatus Woesearchaeota archaeon]|nr:hypothetical protein [Candidatus Woesearchaeota archaeon]
MVEGLGLWGKNIHDTLIKAIKMRFDARHVTKDMSKQKRLEEELDNYATKHEIDKIEEIEDKLNHTAEDATVHSHRLIALDLLILYGIVKYCENFAILLKKEEGEIEKTKKERGPIIKIINKYGLKEKDVKNKLAKVVSDIKDNLKKDRAIILAMENITEGKEAVALQLKEAVSTKARIVRYMKMRIETKRARKELREEEKGLRELMPLLIHLDLIQGIHQKGTTSSRIEKELEDIDKKEKDFVKSAGKGAENVYRLFVNDFLVMRIIILHLYEEENLTEKLAAKHEIPRSIAVADKGKKDKILAAIRNRLQEERQDIKQIWAEINKIQV